jgi:hypothetical protein
MSHVAGPARVLADRPADRSVRLSEPLLVNRHQHLHAAAKAGRAVPDAYTALAKRDERFDVML